MSMNTSKEEGCMTTIIHHLIIIFSDLLPKIKRKVRRSNMTPIISSYEEEDVLSENNSLKMEVTESANHFASYNLV